MRRLSLLTLLLLPGLAAADSRGELVFNKACASCHVTAASAAKAARGAAPGRKKRRELDLAKLKQVKGTEQLLAWFKSPQSINPKSVCDTRLLNPYEVNSLVSYLATSAKPPPTREQLQTQNLEKQRAERRALKKRKATDPSRPAQGKK